MNNNSYIIKINIFLVLLLSLIIQILNWIF